MAFGSHLFAWLGLAAAAAVVYSIALVVYRIFFHPLARYPGPTLAKVSDAYMLYYAWKGERHLEFWRLHERYGPVVRFGPRSLSFNSSSALKTIYGFRANVAKSEFYDAFVHPAPNTHNARDRVLHARKRRVLAQAFSDSAVREVERFILGNIRTFCDVVGPAGAGAGPAAAAASAEKGWSPPRNMADWCNYLAMDILGDLCFGKAFHMLERPDNRYAIDLVGVAAQRHMLCGTMPVINRLSLDKVLFRRIAAGRARYMAYSRAQLTERTRLSADDADRRDFFYHLLRARDPETGAGFSMPELWGESNLLIIAGSDTTSTAMAATLFYLVRSPPALARATRAVRAAFARVEDIHQGPVLAGRRVAYLRACIDEAMRLSPSVGGLLPRDVLAGGLEVDGHALPAGTVVGVPHYAIHHNPTYYPQPFAYRPERWMGGGDTDGEDGEATSADETDDKEAIERAHSAFCAFSIGPRGCIGKGLAYIEMMTALARLLFLYDLRPAAGDGAHTGEGGWPGAPYGRHRAEEYQLQDTFTSLKDGPMVEFRVRADWEV